MRNIDRIIAFILIGIIAFSSLSPLLVKSVNAQTIPATPTFTIKLDSTNHEVPTTYTINQYTGENVTKAGYTVNSLTITLTVTSPNASFYLLQCKGHYASWWETLDLDGYNVTAIGSNTITIQGSNVNGPLGVSPANETTLYFSSQAVNVPFGSQLDFRVQAINGHLGTDPAWRGSNHQRAFGISSAWSNIQTTTIPVPSATASPTPTSTPIISPSTALTSPTTDSVGAAPENPATPMITIAVTAVIVLLVVTILLLVKRDRDRKTSAT
jgi:hypothetical protein